MISENTYVVTHPNEEMRGPIHLKVRVNTYTTIRIRVYRGEGKWIGVIPDSSLTEEARTLSELRRNIAAVWLESHQ